MCSLVFSAGKLVWPFRHLHLQPNAPLAPAGAAESSENTLFDYPMTDTKESTAPYRTVAILT
jgi:hypothetical protein